MRSGREPTLKKKKEKRAAHLELCAGRLGDLVEQVLVVGGHGLVSVATRGPPNF